MSSDWPALAFAGIMNLNAYRLACVLLASLSWISLGCERAPRSASEASESDRQRAIELLDDATSVMRELASISNIPLAQRERARCVVVLPSMVSGGLVLGARRGHGVVTCRAGAQWSGPAFVTITGGTAGLQAGLESSDLIVLVMGERGMAQLFRSSFELGADVSVAAGLVGQGAQASTDAKMTAEIYSYSRTRGLFAGAQVSGAVVKQDQAATFALYGAATDIHAILGGELAAPKEAGSFLAEVRAAFPRLEDETRPQASAR